MFERRTHEHERSTVDTAGDELSPEAADWLLTRLERWHDERDRTSS